MAISFDQIPNSSPASNVKPKGYYKARIIKAEMRQPKNNPSGAAYLALTYDLTATNGKAAGKLWDNFFDIDKDLPRYKLGRIIEACGVLRGATSFELSDLAKVLPNKEMVVAVTTEKNDPERNTADVFEGNIYYPITDWAEKFSETAQTNDLPFSGETSGPINATDSSEY